MESKVFKKRYERVDKYISGIPKPIGGINKEYRPSIYNDEVVDPKVDIPSNKAIFNNVIKTKKSEEQDDDEEDDKKVINEDEQIDKELQAIKDKISSKISKVKDVNQLEFLQFLMANVGFNHDYWKLGKDVNQKLKEEESRATFFQSQNDIEMFQSLMNDTSRKSGGFEQMNSMSKFQG